MRPVARLLLLGLVAAAVLGACDAAPGPDRAEGPDGSGRASSQSAEHSPDRPPAAQQVIDAGAPLELAGPRPSDGEPRRAVLTIEAIGLRDLVVVPYAGVTDDGPGTRIQDRGVAASPHGPGGGTGPGGVGNYQVTAHRTSSTRAFALLPRLRVGERVVVVAAGRRFVYQVVETRETSFRWARSLARQRAAVPGHPGRTPSEAMITLSTCATPEDHAEGNFWSDELGNPEHRIDKIGVLVASRPA